MVMDCGFIFSRERPERSGRDVSGHTVRGAPTGSRSSTSGYGSRETERGVMERGSGGQVGQLSPLASQRVSAAKLFSVSTGSVHVFMSRTQRVLNWLLSMASSGARFG